MLVKFLQLWRCHKPGDEYDVPDGVANILIKQGRAKPLKAEADPAVSVKPYATPTKRREAAK